MSLTQTTTTTTTTTMRVEALSDLQRRLQPAAATAASTPASAQMRFRGAVGTVGTASAPSKTGTAPLTRRFSFVWPFISKENAAATEPFLKSRCSQLLRQFPAFLSDRHDSSARTVRDLISRALTQLKAVWLVLAVYMSLVVLAGLCGGVLYTLLLAAKPPGLLFLVGCVATTGAIAGVSFNARERSQQQQQQQQPRRQPKVQLLVPPMVRVPPVTQMPTPIITVN